MTTVSPRIPGEAPDERVTEEIIDETSESEQKAMFGALPGDAYYAGVKKKRHSQFKGHVHWASIFGLWLLFLFYAVIAFTWLFHLVTPEFWHYATEKNLAVLRHLLFGSIIGALVGQFARKIFED